jgi:hypothetical protein
MSRSRPFFITVCCALLIGWTFAGPDVVETSWSDHVRVLASPDFEGRAPGSPGIERASDYIEAAFREAGLRPAFDRQPVGGGGASGGYRQAFLVPGSPASGYEREGSLTVTGVELVAGEDFVVTANSGSGHAVGPLAFVGYGLDAGPGGYSSFDENTDLSGQIAMLFRLEPLDDDGGFLWGSEVGDHSSLIEKIEAVLSRGAAGVLIVSPPGARTPLGFGDPFGELSPSCVSLPQIPTAVVSRSTAERLLARADPEGRDLLEWRRLADTGAVRTVALQGVSVSLVTRIGAEDVETENVAGMLPGRGGLADEWVVVGAHYDALGRLRGGSSAGEVLPGADDNASGTAAVLVLAERLADAYAASEGGDRRSVVLVAFSAEERGLLGSRHFADNLPVPADKVVAMLNLDMVGRLREDTLWFSGFGSAAEFPELLDPLFEQSGLQVIAEAGGGSSDHVSFWEIGVPALHAMTGSHDELHTVHDSGDSVDAAGAARVIALSEEIVERLARHPAGLTFVEPRDEPGSNPCDRRPGQEAAEQDGRSTRCGGPTVFDGQ